jgi:hypothetical protein
VKSTEKIAQMRVDSAGAFDPEREPTDGEVMIRTALRYAGPLLDQFLPSDPAELDAFLTDAAAEILALRSDDAETVDGDATEVRGELAEPAP